MNWENNLLCRCWPAKGSQGNIQKRWTWGLCQGSKGQQRNVTDWHHLQRCTSIPLGHSSSNIRSPQDLSFCKPQPISALLCGKLGWSHVWCCHEVWRDTCRVESCLKSVYLGFFMSVLGKDLFSCERPFLTCHSKCFWEEPTLLDTLPTRTMSFSSSVTWRSR